MNVSLDELRREVWFESVASRGPGGQNVNKVASAAILYWDPRVSPLVRESARERVIAKLAPVTNRDGLVVIRSDELRDLVRNKTRCLEKLVARLNEALHVPKVRRPTRPTHSSKIKRHETKKRRGETKKLRRRVAYD